MSDAITAAFVRNRDSIQHPDDLRGMLDNEILAVINAERARADAAEADATALRAAGKALIERSPFFVSIGTPDWYCCQFCLRSETTEGLHEDDCEWPAFERALAAHRPAQDGEA